MLVWTTSNGPVLMDHNSPSEGVVVNGSWCCSSKKRTEVVSVGVYMLHADWTLGCIGHYNRFNSFIGSMQCCRGSCGSTCSSLCRGFLWIPVVQLARLCAVDSCGSTCWSSFSLTSQLWVVEQRAVERQDCNY